MPSSSTTNAVAGQALSLTRRFTTAGKHPFDAVEWELRDAAVGSFRQEGVEFPTEWSQNATNIVAQKYFRGQLDAPVRERSVKQMIGRVAGTIADWGRARGYFASPEDGDAFEAELTYLLLHQMAAFNSPVWFNVGFEESPAASACFILSIDDTMESILEWNTKEGKIFRGGSGSGINLSKLRGSMEPLSKGGTASGPVSFMRGADAWAGTIKSGGKTRRAAKMVVLDVDHPDIREFIWCKAREEDKAEALARAGFDMSIDGDGFTSIQYQNANNSVRLTDEFMRAVERDDAWDLIARVDGSVIETVRARELMREIAEAAWRCADPGVQFDTTINEWHTSPNSGRINASNPCFPGDARVHTTMGLLPIEEVVARGETGEDVRVYTHRGTAGSPGAGVVASRPVAFMRNGVKPIVRLRFANGGELRCTSNHRLWTLNRGYVRAEELTSSDRVLLNDAPTPATDVSWELPAKVEALAKSSRRGGTAMHQRLPEHWSEGLGELTGHLVGDGCMTDSSMIWVYGGDDLEDGLADSHEGLLRELIGGVSRQEMDNGTVQLRAGSEAVRDLFRGLGVTGARAHHKRVPEALFCAPVEVQAGFLRGLFGADGCSSRLEFGGKASRYAGLGSRSEALLRDVQRLLSAFGVRGRIYRVSEAETPSFSYTRKDGSTVEYLSREGFDLRITGTDLERFAGAIGFSTPRKEAALASLLGTTARYRTKRHTQLVAREDDGQEEVFNLTEPLHHSYIVDGVVVANCSEYMHVDDSACNLASLNLMRFRRDDGTLDVPSFEHAVDVMLLAQEIVVGPSSYPTEEIAANARAFRQLGLGYANLGAFLMANGVPYDSDPGRGTAAAITALMTGRAYHQSARMAAALGPYERYLENRDAHNGVMRMHRDAAYVLPSGACPDTALLEAARTTWDETVALGDEHGFRNAQATVLAPTGTISFLMDCDTTGIEPDFSLVKFKELVGGGTMTIANRTVPLALRTLGYTPEQIARIEAHITEHGTIVEAPDLVAEHLPVFDVAVGQRAISHLGHIKMMGAAQPFLSGAISKTVNMPHEATVEDIADAYLQAWQLGIKALAIYRDGSKTAQALRTDAGQANDASTGLTQEDVDAQITEALAAAGPARKRMPRERESITHKFSIGGHEGYITAGKYEDGTVGEIFLTDIGKEGSTLRGMMNSFATAISIALQYGVPLETLVQKYSYMRFEPEGITQNPEIPFAKSMPDYIMRWLASRFLGAELQEELGILTQEVRARRAAQDAATSTVTSYTAGPSNGGGNGGGGSGRAKPGNG
ncbi:MAG: ribonucleoside-diphosphate reductase, partial [Solirubrobacterales bacterium]|nr:ribonucleoside-diphosphate reductase [Solirubrobacterales bacterium]